MGNHKGKPLLQEEDLNYITAHTALDRAQVDAYYANFLEEHPGGRINLKAFKKMIKECYPQAPDVDKIGKHIFRMYDSNGDGKIDFPEFMIVLYVLSSGNPEKNLDQIFKIFDIDRNGTISFKEMKRIVKDLYSLFYKPGDAEKESKEDLAKGVFKEMDSNEDGSVTQEEFVTAIMGHEKFSSFLTLKIVDVFIDK